MERKITKEVRVGNVSIGGGSRISIQSMTNTDTLDKEATLKQVERLYRAGCDIIRIAIPTVEAADTIAYIKERASDIPLVADIHFDYKIALRAVECGVDKIRINPGNIGDETRVAEVARACLSKGIPIRIGVNGGSLEKELLHKYGSPTPAALFESAQGHIKLLNRYDFDDIVISVKSSIVPNAIEACKYVSEHCNYPIHMGVTEAGSSRMGIIKNAEAIATLVHLGIGDTVRISLTEDPEAEDYAAKDILRSLGCVGHSGMDIVSCPTCGRTKIDLCSLVNSFEAAVKSEGLSNIPIKVALMGCVVNGPGEAREADIGIAGGKGEALLFKKGEIIKKIDENNIVSSLISYIKDEYKNAK